MLDRAGPQGLFANRSLTNTQGCQQICSSEVEGKDREKNVPLSFLFFFSVFYILFMPLTNSIFRTWNRDKA